MKYYASKISDNLAMTPEGYLLAVGISIGRTGEMEYGADETPIEPRNGLVLISRDEDEVFRPETIASFQGKPFTIKHPEVFVSPDNWKDLAKGVMQNVRRGDGDQKDDLVCDLLITDQNAISLVKNGLRGLSCGYEAEYIQTGEGTGKQVKIVGNHLALVEEGRAGAGYEIKDHKGAKSVDKKFLSKLFAKLSGKTIDQAAFDKAVVDAESAPEENQPAVMDKGMYDELMQICNAMNEKISAMKPKDEKEKEEKKPAGEKAGEDAEGEESSLEERLKKLEEAVSKLLEAKAGDEEEEKSEDADEESEEMGDEEEESEDEESEDEDMEMVGDVKSRAEILAPGIEMTKDVKVKALKAAYGTKDGKMVIDSLTGGKAPSFDKQPIVDALFVGASEILKAQRSNELADSKRSKVGDFQPTIFNGSSNMTAEKMNEMNEKFYNTKK